MAEVRTLEDLAKECFVLLDPSVLIGSQSAPRDFLFPLEFLNEVIDSIYLFKRAVEANPGKILVTVPVCEEYFSNAEDFDHYRKIKLLDAFRATGGIIDFEGLEKSVYEMLRRFSINSRIAYGISEADADIAISGIVLARHRGPTAVVSRDRNLLKFLRDLAVVVEMHKGSLRAYTRKSFDKFKRTYL